MKIAWKMINGYGPYAYLQRSVRDGESVTSEHVKYLGTSVQPGEDYKVGDKVVQVPEHPSSMQKVAPKKAIAKAGTFKGIEVNVTEMKGSPTRLRSGGWGVRIDNFGADDVYGQKFDRPTLESLADEGVHKVVVTARSGSSWESTLTKVVAFGRERKSRGWWAIVEAEKGE